MLHFERTAEARSLRSGHMTECIWYVPSALRPSLPEGQTPDIGKPLGDRLGLIKKELDSSSTIAQ